MKPTAVPVLLVALVLAGCGGDDEPAAATGAAPPATTTAADPATTAPTTATAPATTATETATQAPGDRAAEKAIGEQALLRLADLPSGWREDDDADDRSADSPCPAVEAAKAAVTARAESNTFRAGDGTINSNVYVYPSPAIAQRSFEAITSEATRACLTKAALDPVRAAAKKASATVGALKTTAPPLGALGEAASAYRITLPITKGGREDFVTLAVTATRQGRGLALLTLVGIDDASMTDLATTANRRLQDALAVGP